MALSIAVWTLSALIWATVIAGFYRTFFGDRGRGLPG